MSYIRFASPGQNLNISHFQHTLEIPVLLNKGLCLAAMFPSNALLLVLGVVHLLFSVSALPFDQGSFLDFGMDANEEGLTMMRDVEDGSAGGAISFPEEIVCPFACICFNMVVQCSDLNLHYIPREIPHDTRLLDLQNNLIVGLGEHDFEGLSNLETLVLENNQISMVHPQAFLPLQKMKKLYISHNLLTAIPKNLPTSLVELRVNDNFIKRIPHGVFAGLDKMNSIEMGRNPIQNSGFAHGAFYGLTLNYLRISEAKLTAVPKDLPDNLHELHLDYNQIKAIELYDLSRYTSLIRLGLGYNKILTIDHGSLAYLYNLRELHLDNNRLSQVPTGLPYMTQLQVVHLHSNNISEIGLNAFCLDNVGAHQAVYSGISLFSNPVKYWEVDPNAFRCIRNQIGIQFGNASK
ncbi:biglycan a isoform X2 [Paramormyrops kingsleyae]|uniref:biglycan a isoform X2 n=1 Tax=Paramormyrops kingsleyae TaxID=1676925 RepID=UPI003B96F567